MSLLTRIANAFRPRTIVTERVIAPPALWQQFGRIGGGLTPEDVSNILRSADLGDITRLVDLGHQSRQKDTHLQSVLGTREMAVSGLPMRVIEPQDSSREERKCADLFRSIIDQATGRADDESFGFRELIAHLSSAPYFGFSVAESDWRKRDDRLVPGGFWAAPHRAFAFDQNDGRLKWAPIAGTTSNLVSLPKEHPGRFIQFQPRINGDVQAREGLIRVLTWAALFRNWTLRDWMTLAEIAWKPWRIATYKAGASEEDRQNLWNIISTLTTTGAAVKPESTDLEIHWPGGQVSSTTGGQGAHNELYKSLAEGISKAVLGQTLTTEASQRGTQALGTVHNLVREDILNADASSISAVLMRDLWSVVKRLNFSERVRTPVVILDTSVGRDQLAFSQAVKNLSDAGVPGISAKWVLSEFGAPEAEEGEPLVVPITVDLSRMKPTSESESKSDEN